MKDLLMQREASPQEHTLHRSHSKEHTLYRSHRFEHLASSQVLEMLATGDIEPTSRADSPTNSLEDDEFTRRQKRARTEDMACDPAALPSAPLHPLFFGSHAAAKES